MKKLNASFTEEGLSYSDTIRFISDLDLSKKQYFYEMLALNLTIVFRRIWSENLIAEEKLENLLFINEMQHGLVQKIHHLRLGTNDYSDQLSIDIIADYVEKFDGAADYVADAIIKAGIYAGNSENRTIRTD